MTSLTVLCPNAHRCRITTTPGKLLQEVHEEACMRQGYDSTKYGLQSQRKFVDLSLPIHLCGLPNNATLELIKKESISPDANVQVAVQGEFGRHMHDFLASTSLAQILDTFTPLTGIDLLCKSEELLVPSIGYMNKLYKGADVLSKNTLKSIGIETGRALFRYAQIRVTPEELEQMRQSVAAEEARRLQLMELYKRSKEENEQRAMLDEKYRMDVEQRELKRLAEQKRLDREAKAVKEQEVLGQQQAQVTPSITQNSRLNQLETALNTVSASLSDGASDNLVDQIMREDGRIRIDKPDKPINVQQPAMPFANFKFPEVPVSTFADLMADELRQNADQYNVRAPERRAVLFERKPQQLTEVDESESDEFFEVTAVEAKRMQRELSEQVKSLSQQALLPKSFIDKKNKEKKIQAYRRTVIRIRFEEHVFVQGQFLSVEPVNSLFEFVVGLLQPNAPEFSLALVLNEKLTRSKDKDFIDVGLAPVATVMIFFKGVKSSRNFIKTDTLQECTSEEADLISQEWLSTNSAFQREVFVVGGESETQLKKRSREEPSSSSADQAQHHKSPSMSDPLPKWLRRQ